MQTLIDNWVPILVYGLSFLGVFLRIRVEVLRIVRTLKANQRNARDAREEESDQLAHIPQSADQAKARRAELIAAGYTEAPPGFFFKSVKPVRCSASASMQGRDPTPVA